MAFIDSQNILVLEKNTGDVRLVSDGQLMKKPILHLDVDSTTPICCRGLLGIAINNKNSTMNENVYIFYGNRER